MTFSAMLPSFLSSLYETHGHSIVVNVLVTVCAVIFLAGIMASGLSRQAEKRDVERGCGGLQIPVERR
jgi:hypothetical protein